ncbi:RICIN domain-containing protein, partial [Streptomyces alkaliphilus]|uniref:RICIN domain-containing protein n=1 Tax=Streptomyces alkaliphilus TaxID=1472722 RepID=UPI001180C631
PTTQAPAPEPEQPRQAAPAPAAPPLEDFSRPTGRIMGLAAKCLEARSTSNGSELMLNACHGGASQQWTFHRDGTLRIAGLCLSTAGNSTNDGARVVLRGCGSGGNIQQWRVSPNADIVNFAADKCLDVANANTANGTPIQIAICSGNPAQKWTVP